MKDQNSIDVKETSTQKYERALDLFTESDMKPCLLYTSDAADE